MKNWTPKEVMNLFRIEKTKTSLYKDEEKGVIPKAKRIERGKNYIRMWSTDDLPRIGEIYGFLSQPKEQKIISIYTPKGGVLKSTLAFNLARMLALHNISTLIIGLEVQGTITHNLRNPEESPESLDDIENIQELTGLYEAIKNKDINASILSTDLPSLSYIPESSNLNHLEQDIRNANRREYVIKSLLSSVKNDFKVIIFDNSPSWNFLIQNSLVAATDIISPISCDLETFRSLTQNIEMLNNFKKNMELDWNNFILVPTKLERNKLSKQIETHYRSLFPELITTTTIRSAIKGQESSLEQSSIIEYDSKSPLAQDYYDVINDIWSRINKDG